MLEKSLSQYHLVYHKSSMDWLGSNPTVGGGVSSKVSRELERFQLNRW
jgi:hypothetical protein